MRPGPTLALAALLALSAIALVPAASADTSCSDWGCCQFLPLTDHLLCDVCDLIGGDWEIEAARCVLR